MHRPQGDMDGDYENKAMNNGENQIKLALLGELNKETLLQLIPELVSTIGCQQNHPGHSV